MRRLSWLALAALVGGASLLAYGAALGQGQVHLVLVFPVFTGTGLVSIAGILLIAVGMFLGFLSFAQIPLVWISKRTPAGPALPEPTPASPPEPHTGTTAKKFGGVVFLGPIPIVFGSDTRVSRIMLLLAIAMTVLLLAFFLLVLRAP